MSRIHGTLVVNPVGLLRSSEGLFSIIADLLRFVWYHFFFKCSANSPEVLGFVN